MPTYEYSEKYQEDYYTYQSLKDIFGFSTEIIQPESEESWD